MSVEPTNVTIAGIDVDHMLGLFMVAVLATMIFITWWGYRK